MTAPWNVRVTPRHYTTAREQENPAVPDYFLVETRERGRWICSGTARTWLEAFLMGVAT